MMWSAIRKVAATRTAIGVARSAIAHNRAAHSPSSATTSSLRSSAQPSDQARLSVSRVIFMVARRERLRLTLVGRRLGLWRFGHCACP
jgi:hypothetical protein